MERYPVIRQNRRNVQPVVTPYSSRVGSDNKYVRGEVDYLRDSIQAGLERTGNLFAHFRRYTADWNQGVCPRCYGQGGSRGSARPECNICFGTGWEGAYSRPAIQRMLIQDIQEKIEVEPTGFLRVNRGDSYSPAIPRISQDDVLVRIYNSDLEWKTGDRYEVLSGVEEIRSRDEVAELSHGTEDHLDYAPEVIGYKFQTTKLVKNRDERARLPQFRIPIDNPIFLADTDPTRR